MNILITGAAGFIGSHTAVELLAAGHYTVLLDNFSNSSPAVLERIAEISGRRAPFYQGDIRDRALLRRVFAVFSIVFSSSATVYGNPARVPIDETMPTGATTNPYGTSKHIIETVLRDLAAADMRWSAVLLRYFNPIGAHPGGRIGEDPKGIPNNLLPYICRVAAGTLPELSVFGSDYPTPDGTGVRDYIHVVDLARGHLKALEAKAGRSGVHTYNLGTGRGYSVLEVVRAFERASGRNIPYALKPRRPGDIAQCYADASRAAAELGWQAQYGLDDMMRDSWNWQRNNPEGYGSQ